MADKTDTKTEVSIWKELSDIVVSVSKNIDKMHQSISAMADMSAALTNVLKEFHESMPSEDSLTSIKELVNDISDMSISLSDSMKNTTEAVNASAQTATVETQNMTIELGNLIDKTKGLNDLSNSFIELGESTKNPLESITSLSGMLNNLSKGFSKANPVMSAFVVGGLHGMKQGFKNLTAIGKGAIGFLTNFTSTVFNVGLAIAAIPFKLLDTLIDMAESGPMDTSLAQAFEAIRREFGSFKSEAAATSIQLAKTFKGFSETGLSTFRIFGNAAEKLTYTLELIKGFGMTLGAFVKEFTDHGGRLAAYQKALGITSEEYRTLGEVAISTGRELQDVSLELTKYTLAFSGGVIDKRFSRQMQKAVADVRHFGGASMKEIARATAYAKGLHIELEKIVGVMDAFNTFDTAAENSAKLAQSFGMTVDAFKMVSAQSPDEMLDHLRSSFQATGKSVSDFSRQQWQLMSQTTGLSEDVVRLAMSEKNRGKNLQQLQREADKAKGKQMSQAEAMKKIADAIERLVKQGESLKGGFFDQFFKGMLRGIEISREFRTLMMNIRLSLRVALMEGIKFGQWLMSDSGFTGLSEIISSLGGLFKPDSFKSFFSSFRETLQNGLFNLIHGEGSFEQLMDGIKLTFLNFFNLQTPQGQQLARSLEKGLEQVVKILSSALEWASKKVTEGLNFITDLLSGKTSFDKLVPSTSVGGKLLKILEPLWKSLQKASKPLWEAIKNLLSVVFNKLKTFVTSGEFWNSYIKPAILPIIGIIFGPALMNAAATGASVFFSKLIINSIIGGSGLSFGKVVSILTKFFSSTAGKVAAGATGILAVIFAGLSVSEGMKKFRDKITGDFTDTQKTISAGLTGIIDTLTFGLIPDFILQGVANLGATLLKSFEGMLNDVLPGLGDSVMGNIGGLIKTLQGIGDILIGVFKGDSSRISDGLVNVFTGLFDVVINNFITAWTKIPLLIAKTVFNVALTIQSGIVNLLGNVLNKIGLTTLGNFTKQTSILITEFKDIICGAFDVVSAAITFAYTAIKYVIYKIITSFEDGKSKISEYCGIVKNSIIQMIDPETVNEISEVFEKVNNHFKYAILPTIQGIYNDIFELFSKIKKSLSEAVSWLKEGTAEMNAKMSSDSTKSAEETAKNQTEKAIEAANKGSQAGAKAAEGKGFDALSGLKDLFAGKSNIGRVSSGFASQLDSVENNLKVITKERITKLQKTLDNSFKSGGVIEQLKVTLDSNKDRLETISTLGSDLKPLVERLKNSELKGVLNAAADIIQAANELDKALSDGNINKLNVAAKLQRVANSVGIKNAKYTIENKQVQITLNLTVSMNADDVEKVIIQRKESIIRDRLNHVAGGYSPSKVPDYSIPNTLEQKPVSIGNGD